MTSASLRCASTATPPKGPSWPSALHNYAGPQHFCLFRGMCSAWVPGSVLGSLAWEIEPSLPARSWPNQASVLPLYSVTLVTSRPNRGRLMIVARRCQLLHPAYEATPQNAKRRSSEYVSAPAARALTPTAAVVATAAPDGAGIRSRSDTGLENVSTGQLRAAASLRSARSGFTTVGCPTALSIGRSVTESEYA